MKKWIFCLVLGVVFLIGSTGWLRADEKPTEITCGNETMHPGDVCQETRRGVTVDTETYEEKVREAAAEPTFANTGRWVMLGIGLGLECLGIAGMVITKRRRARRPLTTADLALNPQAYPGYAPGHVQQPGQQMWPQGTTPRPPNPPAPQHHPHQPFGPGR
jgi:hypothetical protein